MPQRYRLPPTFRAGNLRGLERLLRDLQVDEMTLMADAGLSPRQMSDPESRVSLVAGFRLLEMFARRSGREDVGLLIAQDHRLSNLGTLGLITVLQADLRQALQVLIARRSEVISGLMVELEEHDGIAVLRLDYVVAGTPYARQATEFTLCVFVQLMRQFLGQDWTPRRVCLRHPPPADLRTHRKVLGWSVEFEHDFNGIVLTSQDLDTSAPLQDPVLADLAMKTMSPSTTQSSVAQTCREHLVVLLPLGLASIDQVAARMGLQRRTLQRRLDQEGLTFSALLQSLREDLLQSQMAGSDVRWADMAMQLGFSAPSAFSRWHRATFGMPARSRCSSILG